MILTNQTVIHKAFGRGVAAGIEGAYLSVLFPCGEKRFVFPDAFRQFLRFEDTQTQAEVEEMIENLHAERREQSAVRACEVLSIVHERQQEIEAAAREEAALMAADTVADALEDGYTDEYSIFDWRTLSLESLKNRD